MILDGRMSAAMEVDNDGSHIRTEEICLETMIEVKRLLEEEIPDDYISLAKAKIVAVRGHVEKLEGICHMEEYRKLILQMIKTLEKTLADDYILPRTPNSSLTLNVTTKKEEKLSGPVTTQSSVKFADVAGFEEEKQKLTEAIHDPVMYPLAYDLAVQPVRTVLMFGPPGTGKTLLARAIAGEIGAVLFNIASADLLSKWQGDSEKAVRSLFDAALNQDKPAVIFMDEIDSLCRIRTTEENDSTRRIKTELMTQMQRIDESCKAAQMSGKPLKYVCFLGATNCPWDIDSAFMRRFEEKIYMGLPTWEARMQILQMNTAGHAALTEAEWHRAGKETDGFSGSDLKRIANAALKIPIRELKAATRFIRNEDGSYTPTTEGVFDHKRMKIIPPTNQMKPRSLTIEDLMAAAKQVDRTVKKEFLRRYSPFISTREE